MSSLNRESRSNGLINGIDLDSITSSPAVNGLDINEDSLGGSSIRSSETETSQNSSNNKTTKRKIGKKSSKKNSAANKQQKQQQYKLTYHLKELDNQPIFGVAFNPHLQASGHHVFATASGRRVSIYECLDDGSVKILQVYADPDPEENFYAVVWTYDDVTLNPILVTAGGRGIIRVISPGSKDIKHLKGHGQSINDLKMHPTDSNLLLSVSKDHSLRLWNIKTDICVAIFGGVEGHRDEVLSADFHKSGHRIVSCGMDHSLKIWATDTEDIELAIQESYTYDKDRAERPFRTVRCQIPSFTTRDIHRNYVDCVRWFGNFVMSKSCENAIVLWKPGKLDTEDDIELAKGQYTSDSTTTFIHQFELKDSEIWFMRFSMDMRQKTMALGNMSGKTYVWDLDPEDPVLSKVNVLVHPKCTAAIRQTSLSNDGSILLCVSDNATIWRWDRDPGHACSNGHATAAPKADIIDFIETDF